MFLPLLALIPSGVERGIMTFVHASPLLSLYSTTLVSSDSRKSLRGLPPSFSHFALVPSLAFGSFFPDLTSLLVAADLSFSLYPRPAIVYIEDRICGSSQLHIITQHTSSFLTIIRICNPHVEIFRKPFFLFSCDLCVIFKFLGFICQSNTIIAIAIRMKLTTN